MSLYGLSTFGEGRVRELAASGLQVASKEFGWPTLMENGQELTLCDGPYSTVTHTRLQVKRGERSAIRMVLSSTGLCYDAVRPTSDFVNDADEAVETATSWRRNLARAMGTIGDGGAESDRGDDRCVTYRMARTTTIYRIDLYLMLCEIVGGYVWFIVDDQPMRLDRCSRHVLFRLVECPLDEDKVAQEPVCYAPV
jgi:hypothetical protein